jgi:hypothetical protein
VSTATQTLVLGHDTDEMERPASTIVGGDQATPSKANTWPDSSPATQKLLVAHEMAVRWLRLTTLLVVSQLTPLYVIARPS